MKQKVGVTLSSPHSTSFSPGFQFIASGQTLVIGSVSASDDGSYVCQAINTAGAAVDSLTVDVLSECVHVLYVHEWYMCMRVLCVYVCCKDHFTCQFRIVQIISKFCFCLFIINEFIL